jgi:transcription initiation factor IIF auxiliary subunit
METTVMAMENATIDKEKVSAFVMKVSFHLHASIQLKTVRKLKKVLMSFLIL